MIDLDRLIDDINKKHGAKTLRMASELEPVTCLPIGLPNFDIDLGGGLLWGRTTLISGNEATGKTTSAYLAAHSAQAIGMPVFWLDLEKSFDAERAKVFGVDPENNFYVIRGEYAAEQVFALVRDILDAFNKQTEFNQRRVMIVVDSIALMISEQLMEHDASANYGGSARVINQALGVWTLKTGPNQIIFCINQLRDSMQMMGEDKLMPGGEGQKYFASSIIWYRNGETLKDGTKPVGKELKWTIKKSRSSAPKEVGAASFLFETGFNYTENLILTAVELGIIERTGAWYILPGTEEKVQGQAALIRKLETDTELLKTLKEKVYSYTNVPVWDGKEKD